MGALGRVGRIGFPHGYVRKLTFHFPFPRRSKLSTAVSRVPSDLVA